MPSVDGRRTGDRVGNIVARCVLLLAVPMALALVLPLLVVGAVPPARAVDPADANAPTGVLESVTTPAVGKMRITGWAADADSPQAALLVGVSVDSAFVGKGWRADVSRPDLGLSPEYGARHGYVIDLDAAPGWRWVCTWANSVPDSTRPAFVRCQYAWVQPPPPDTRITGSERQGDAQAFLFETLGPQVTPAVDLDTAPPVPASTQQCSWDGSAWSPCTSPARATLGSGPHTFAVRAVGAAGDPDPTPAVQEFSIPAVQGPPLTDSAIVLGVKAVKRKDRLRVGIRPASAERDYAFRVERLRRKKWRTVKRVRTSGPRDVTVLDLGRGGYRVVVKDQHGLVGTTSQTVRLKR